MSSANTEGNAALTAQEGIGSGADLRPMSFWNRASFKDFVKLVLTLVFIHFLMSNKSSLLKIAIGFCAAPLLQEWFGDKWSSLASLVWAQARAIITLCNAIQNQNGPLLAVFAVITVLAVLAFACSIWAKICHRTNSRQGICLFLLIGVALNAVLDLGDAGDGCPVSNHTCKIAHGCTMQAFLLLSLALGLEATGLVRHSPFARQVLAPRQTDSTTIVAVVMYWMGTIFGIIAIILHAPDLLE